MTETYCKELKVTYNNLSGKYNVVDYNDDEYGCPKGQGDTPEEAIQKCLHLLKSCREMEVAMFKKPVSDIAIIDGIVYSISSMSRKKLDLTKNIRGIDFL